MPAAGLPRWNAVQHRLYEVLTPLGADRAALDAARVFRLIGTTNRRSDSLVEALTPAAARYDFKAMAAQVLPVAREDIREKHRKREARLASLEVERARRGREQTGAALTVATLWRGRLSELYQLLNHRWWGCAPSGHRDAWMFVAGVAMSWLCPPAVLRRELQELGHHCASWDAPEVDNRPSSVVSRAEAAMRGETVRWGEREVDPRYRMRAETIAEWLSVTEAEMRELGLRHIVSAPIAAELEAGRRAAWNETRRTKGQPDRPGHVPTGQNREAWNQQAAARAAQARELRSQGLTWEAVGAMMGISKDAARMLASRST